MNLRHVVAVLASLAGLLALPAAADVVESTTTGFQLRFETTVAVPPDKAYAALVGDVGKWWNMDHSYSRDGKNLTIDARPGGCFCEKLPNGGGVEHMRVVFAAPGNTLRLQGGLGPLQTAGVVGSMAWRFIAAPNGTKIEMSYSVGGYLQGGLDKVSGAVNGVLGEQFTRLKTYIETGKPAA